MGTCASADDKMERKIKEDVGQHFAGMNSHKDLTDFDKKMLNSGNTRDQIIRENEKKQKVRHPRKNKQRIITQIWEKGDDGSFYLRQQFISKQ